MSELRVKTRMRSSVNGKRKVYFSCIPEDKIYFESVSNDILKTEGVGCAIYYYDSFQKPTMEERFESILQCTLYVCIVTSKFFAYDKTELDDEIAFALKNRKKVLPIVMKEGLEAEFNKKFGSVQCLVKKDGYESRLQSFLSEAVYSDKKIRKIKDAFDGYIFLSYRKKDRDSALKLMKAIHNTKKFRNVGIWFDDFLAPGENFDDSILDAMKKSLFVVLNVTPNIVSEQNYVLSTEYPFAVKNGIEVIGAQTVETDGNELKTKFKGMVVANSISDTLKLLNEAYDRHVKKPKPETPERNYLLALAFYSGINTEINPTAGDILMRKSARGDYSPAIEYLLRNGVAKGEERLNLILQLKKKRWYEYTGATEKKTARMTDYLNTVLDLACEYIALKKYKEAHELCKEVLKKSQYHSKSAYMKSYFYSAQIKMAEIYILEDKKDRAENLFKKISEDIENYPKRGENIIRNLYDGLMNRMASFYLNNNRADEARECYRKALEVTSTGISNENRVYLQMYTQHQYGHCYAIGGEYEKAETAFENAYRMKKDYIKYHDKPDDIESFLVTVDYLLSIKFRLGKKEDCVRLADQLERYGDKLIKKNPAYKEKQVSNLRYISKRFGELGMSNYEFLYLAYVDALTGGMEAAPKLFVTKHEEPVKAEKEKYSKFVLVIAYMAAFVWIIISGIVKLIKRIFNK